MSSSDPLTPDMPVPDPDAGHGRRILLGCGAVVFGVVLLVAVVIGLPLPVASVVALILGGVAAWVVHRSAQPLTLRLTRASPAEDEGRNRRYHNLVEGLCTTAGTPKPRLYVVDDAAANALVCGVNRRDVALVVTTGLLDGLTRVELEGVLAELLVKLRDQDVPAMTLMVPFAFVIPAPLTARLLRYLAPPTRETVADLTAVGVTRYPPGLAEALEALAREGTAVASMSHATEHLWLAEPVAPTGADAGPAGHGQRSTTHPPLTERAALLREL